MFTQVVATLFRMIVEFEYHWKEIRQSQPSAVYGFGLGAGDQVAAINVNTQALFDSFRKGVSKYGEVWSQVLSSQTQREVETLANLGDVSQFHYDTKTWVHILFDYIVATRKAQIPESELIASPDVPWIVPP